MDHLCPHELELIERAGWLNRQRWLAVLVGGVALAAGWLWFPDYASLVPLAVVALAVALYNTQLQPNAWILRVGQDATEPVAAATRVMALQILLDMLALAAAIALTGGIRNPLAPALVVPLILAGMLLPRRLSLLAAVLASVLLGIVAWLEYAGILAGFRLPFLEPVESETDLLPLLSWVAGLAIVLWVATLVVSSVNSSQRRRARALMDDQQNALARAGELQSLNRRLRRLDSERTRFVSLVAHELRSPINTIHTCVEYALASYASPEKAREILERVLQRTTALSELVSDLQRLAEARQASSLDEKAGLVRPGEILRSVVDLMQAEADKRDLFLSVDIEPGVAPVHAGSDGLKIVWTNLLSNAIKYTEPGGVVAVAQKECDGQLVGSVRDTGIGIPAEDLDRIFEELYRAENARALSPVGTGVGLAIVRRMIEGWGGTIAVESELGLGTKFTFLIPVSEV